MKLFSNLTAFMIISVLAMSCVTTRAQMNQERASASPASDPVDVNHEKPMVRSEEIKEPSVVQSPSRSTAQTASQSPVQTQNTVAAPAPVSQTANTAPMLAAPMTAAPAAASATSSTNGNTPPPMNAANTSGAVPMTAAIPADSSPTSQTTQTLPSTAAAAGSSGTILKGDLSQYGVDELRVEVARLSGRVEELEHDKQLSDQAHQDEMKKSDAHVAELEKKLKDLQPDAPTLAAGQTPLMAGKEAFLNAKYDDAILFMNQVLEKEDTGKDAEEATFVRGESYFKKQQYNKAIVDFSHFPEKFQKSSYHPKALLRIGECFEAMGRKDDAKAFYSDLADKFPKTAEGKLAKKRLKSKV